MKSIELKFSGFESLHDLDRTIGEAIEDMDLDGEFTGTITVTISYDDND